MRLDLAVSFILLLQISFTISTSRISSPKPWSARTKHSRSPPRICHNILDRHCCELSTIREICKGKCHSVPCNRYSSETITMLPKVRGTDLEDESGPAVPLLPRIVTAGKLDSYNEKKKKFRESYLQQENLVYKHRNKDNEKKVSITRLIDSQDLVARNRAGDLTSSEGDEDYYIDKLFIDVTTTTTTTTTPPPLYEEYPNYESADYYTPAVQNSDYSSNTVNLDYTQYITRILETGDHDCLGYLRPVFYCASQSRNNGRCCKGAPYLQYLPHCHIFCNPNTQYGIGSFKQEHGICLDHWDVLMQCHRHGLSKRIVFTNNPPFIHI